MSSSSKRLVLFIFVLFNTCSSSLFWRIESSPPAYIFGTLHLPYELIWPFVPKEVQTAFESSTDYYFEIDARSASYWDDLLYCLLNRSARIERSIKSSNLSDLLDVYLADKATRSDKTVGSLETIEFYCENPNSRYNLTTWIIIVDYIREMIRNSSLSMMEAKIPSFAINITKDYLCGRINDKYVENLGDTTSEIEQMNTRDKHMAQRIHKLLKTSKKKRYFFAVGAFHMFGRRQNIIELLKQYGYKITRLCTYQNRVLKKFGCKSKTLLKACVQNKSKINKKT